MTRQSYSQNQRGRGIAAGAERAARAILVGRGLCFNRLSLDSHQLKRLLPQYLPPNRECGTTSLADNFLGSVPNGIVARRVEKLMPFPRHGCNPDLLARRRMITVIDDRQQIRLAHKVRVVVDFLFCSALYSECVSTVVVFDGKKDFAD